MRRAMLALMAKKKKKRRPFGGDAGDCSFSSLAQCREPPPGEMLPFRAANPYFNARADMPIDRSRQPQRRF